MVNGLNGLGFIRQRFQPYLVLQYFVFWVFVNQDCIVCGGKACNQCISKGYAMCGLETSRQPQYDLIDLP